MVVLLLHDLAWLTLADDAWVGELILIVLHFSSWTNKVDLILAK